MEPIDEQRAVEIAREVARDSYGEILGYEITVDETDSDWRIHFHRPGALERGGHSHFAVWVDKTSGEPRLFRGR